MRGTAVNRKETMHQIFMKRMLVSLKFTPGLPRPDEDILAAAAKAKTKVDKS
jgi:hypothetical protein